MIGQFLGGYEILEEVGSGGMATVYKAYDPGTDRHVAIKVMPDHYSKQPAFRERFQREARAIARLEHVHILPIFSYGEDADRAYLVMRYMPTGTLSDLLAAGPLDFAEASRLLGQMAAALDAAHEQGIIHRDVKPSNILLDKQRNAYLSDFGIAKLLESSQHLTGSGIIGTPAYMSPEQSHAKATLTGATDQYSLGIILYQMVTGSRPFEAETPLATILQHINDPLPDPREPRPDLPPAAAQVIERALAKNPDDRFASCSEMASAFANAISGVPSAAPKHASTPAPQAPTRRALRSTVPDGVPTMDVTLPRRRINPIIFGLLALLLICGVVAVFAVLNQPSDNGGPFAAVGTPVDSSNDAALEQGDAGQAAGDPTRPLDSQGAGEQTAQPFEYLDLCGLDLCIKGDHASVFLGLDTTHTINWPGRSWSPDGSEIVFDGCLITESECLRRLWRMNRDGSSVTEFRATDSWQPAWSPDGEWIAFVDGCYPAIIRPDGTGLTRLSDDVECVNFPAWSPDSQWIVWIDTDQTPPDFPLASAWVAKIDGSDVHPIYINPDEPFFWSVPAWSPDGTSIVFHMNDGTVMSFDPLCDARTETCEGTPLDAFPEQWTHFYFPQWIGTGEVGSATKP